MNTARFCQFRDVWGNKWSFCSVEKKIGTTISSRIFFSCLMKSIREHYAYCKYCKQDLSIPRIPKGLNNRNLSSAYHYAILTYNEASKWSQCYLNWNFAMSEGTSEASVAKKRKLGQRFRPEYSSLALWNRHGNIMPIANIANKLSGCLWPANTKIVKYFTRDCFPKF
jgi:hypothetical protein